MRKTVLKCYEEEKQCMRRDGIMRKPRLKWAGLRKSLREMQVKEKSGGFDPRKDWRPKSSGWVW